MREQYSLAKILGIWALAAAPMGILGWIAFPLLAPDFESNPFGSGVTRVVLLTLGLIWLFVLSMIIVRREEAPAQRPAGASDRPTPRKALVVGGAFPCCGLSGRTRTEHSIRKRLGVS